MSEENKETSFSAFNDYLRKSREGYTEINEDITPKKDKIVKKSEIEDEADIPESIEDDSEDIIDIASSSDLEGDGNFTPQFVEKNKSDEENDKEDRIDVSDLITSNEDDGEEETEENQYFDPLEEQLIYSSNDDEVNFNDLNNSYDEDDEEDEDKSEEKTSSKKVKFDELNGSKGKYMAGKSRKTLILSLLVGILAFLLLCLEVKKISSDRKAAQEARKTHTDVNTDSYNPDFGDYASRAHIQTQQESNQSDVNYVEGLLTTNDRTNYEEKKPVVNTTPTYQPQTSSVPASSAWSDAMKSSIRYSGFNGKGGTDLIPQLGGKNSGYGTNASYLPYMSADPVANYMDSYSQILGSLTSAAGQNGTDAKDSKRNFNNGAYDKNAQSSVSQIPENSIYPGTIIHAVMVSGINTDYPGAITARVINNVYDSKTGKKLLIPSGSILRGSYSSASIGVSRIQIAWTDLILNRDGKDYLVNLGSMIGVDRKGYSGIRGTINDHYFAYLRAMGLSTLFTVLNQNVYKYSNAQKSASKRELISENQELANRLTDKLLDRALDIEPTIVISPGTLISVDVDKVLTLDPYTVDIPKGKYVRK